MTASILMTEAEEDCPTCGSDDTVNSKQPGLMDVGCLACGHLWERDLDGA